MPDKVAFVFDTNFIIQNRGLTEVVNNLDSNGYSAYVPQVAIDERIAQESIKRRTKYEKVEAFSKEIAEFASITVTKSYPETEKRLKIKMQKSYANLFGANIIPFKTDADMFRRILERAYMKAPPFITVGTDKGFKDSLMWLSILDYFPKDGEDKVVFVSSDNGFKESNAYLCQEFKSITGKTIDIKDNSFYREILDVQHKTKESVLQEKLPNVSQLRERIHQVIEGLCGEEMYNDWDTTNWERTFIVSKRFDSDYIACVFSGLRSDLNRHIFDQSVSATDILGLDDCVEDGNVRISMSALEQVVELHDEIKHNYPEFVQQFYLTAADILNQNYSEPVLQDSSEELPF